MAADVEIRIDLAQSEATLVLSDDHAPADVVVEVGTVTFDLGSPAHAPAPQPCPTQPPGELAVTVLPGTLEVELTQIAVEGEQGPPGPRGPPYGDEAYDPGDLTLIFENKLI